MVNILNDCLTFTQMSVAFNNDALVVKECDFVHSRADTMIRDILCQVFDRRCPTHVHVAFNKELHGVCAFTGRHYEETYDKAYPVENQDPTIKESPILPRCHGHIVEETKAKSLQSISLRHSTPCV